MARRASTNPGVGRGVRNGMLPPLDTAGLDFKALGWTEAVYKPQKLQDYQGNPFIEALPEIADDRQAVNAIRRGTPVNDEERALPTYLRRHVAMRIASVVHPLSIHVTLWQNIAIVIRLGYIKRNWAIDGRLPRQQLAEFDQVMSGKMSRTVENKGTDEAVGVTVMGGAGVGKSTGVRMVLINYPQVILHSEYNGTKFPVLQLVWIKLTCPPDGSLRSLCIWFFRAVDDALGVTRYTDLYVHSRSTEASMQQGMLHVIARHALGVVCIDEIQNLREAKGNGAEHVMSYLTTLSNVMRVPVLAIGTDAARSVLGGALRQGRRATGVGQPEFTRLPNDREFANVCRVLWKSVVLREIGELSVSLISTLHHLSQGIMDILVKLLTVAQANALSIDYETLDAPLLQAAYDRHLYLIHPFLEEIRANRKVDEVEFQKAMEETAERVKDVEHERVEPPAPPKVKKKRAKAATPEHVAPLVQIVEAGRASGLDPHAALTKAGLISDMAAEADAVVQH